MGFGAEMKDFVSGFKAGSDFVGGIQKDKRERARDERRDGLTEREIARREAKDAGFNSGEDKDEFESRFSASTRTPGGGDDSESARSRSHTPDQESAARERFDYLVNEKKLNPVAAAGIIGNTWSEGGFNPTVVGDNGTSYGEFQHRNERWTGLKNWAAENNRDVKDWRTQYDFAIDHEGSTTHKQALDAINKAKTPEEAADSWALYFERPKGAETGDPNNILHIGRRRQRAGLVYGWGSPQRTASAEGEEGSALFAAEGGAIPSPNAVKRSFTQEVAAAPASDFVPRRVGQAAPSSTGAIPPKTPAGTGFGVGQVTPGQQALRDKRAARATAAAAPPAAPAAPAGPGAGANVWNPRHGVAPTVQGATTQELDALRDDQMSGYVQTLANYNGAYPDFNPFSGKTQQGFGDYARWRMGQAQFETEMANARDLRARQIEQNQTNMSNQRQEGGPIVRTRQFAQGGPVDRYMPEEGEDTPLPFDETTDRYVPEGDEPTPHPFPNRDRQREEGPAGLAGPAVQVSDRYMPESDEDVPDAKPETGPERPAIQGGYEMPQEEADSAGAAAKRLSARNEAYRLMEAVSSEIIEHGRANNVLTDTGKNRIPDMAHGGVGPDRPGLIDEAVGAIPGPVKEGAAAAGSMVAAGARRVGEVASPYIEKAGEAVAAIPGRLRAANDAINAQTARRNYVPPQSLSDQEDARRFSATGAPPMDSPEMGTTPGFDGQAPYVAPGPDGPPDPNAPQTAPIPPRRPNDNVPLPPRRPDAPVAGGPQLPGFDPREAVIGPEEGEPNPDAPQTARLPPRRPTADAPAAGAKTARGVVSEKHPAVAAGAKKIFSDIDPQKGGAAIGNDPRRNDAMNRYLRSEDALSGEEYKQLMGSIDPEGKMHEADRYMKAQQDMYDWYMAKGYPEKAVKAAASVALYGKKMTQVAGGMAIAALENGDLVNAAQWMTKGYAYVPDGFTIEVDRQQPIVEEGGKQAIRYRMVNRFTGETQGGGEGGWDSATREELYGLAGKMANSTAWATETVKAAQGLGQTGRSGGNSDTRRAERNAQMEDARLEVEDARKALDEAKKGGDQDAVAEAQENLSQAESGFRRIAGSGNVDKALNQATGRGTSGAGRGTANERRVAELKVINTEADAAMKAAEKANDKAKAATIARETLDKNYEATKDNRPSSTAIADAVASAGLDEAEQTPMQELVYEILLKNQIPPTRAIAAVQAARAPGATLNLSNGKLRIGGFGQPLFVTSDMVKRLRPKAVADAGT